MSNLRRAIDAFNLDPETGERIAELLLLDSKHINNGYQQNQLLPLSNAIPEFLNASPELLLESQSANMRSLCILLRQNANELLSELSVAASSQVGIFKYCVAVMLIMKVCSLYDEFFHSSHVLRLLLIWRSIQPGDGRDLLKCIQDFAEGLTYAG